MSSPDAAALRILVFDFSGHPFQAELSRELAGRGHRVLHGSCAAYVCGKGDLAEDVSGVEYQTIGRGTAIRKSSFYRRFFQELRLGFELLGMVRGARPDVVLVSTTPVPMTFVLALVLWFQRTPWVLWHQDIQGIAVENYAREHMPSYFQTMARGYSWAECWCARRARAIIAISDSFLSVHREWGTEDKVTVIPNWAPLQEIRPMARDNDWAREHGLVGEHTLLYSGTLGLKHRPELLPQLARAVADQGEAVRLVVINEGPATKPLQDEARRLRVPLTLLPFQPYDRLPEVLATGDVLVVLLEESAGSFSVPSKTLSYLAAGRPIIGFMPGDNLAADLVTQAGGQVVPPRAQAVDEAARWTVEVLADDDLRSDLGRRSRELAEREFDLARCAVQFEEHLREASTQGLWRGLTRRAPRGVGSGRLVNGVRFALLGLGRFRKH